MQVIVIQHSVEVAILEQVLQYTAILPHVSCLLEQVDKQPHILHTHTQPPRADNQKNASKNNQVNVSKYL